MNIRRNILVIYCGGTIGMKKNKKGAYEPEPNAFIEKIRSYPELHDKTCGITEKNQFVINVDGISIHYSIVEYSPLLDSSNMSTSEWVRIAKDIMVNYEKFDAFVILHGTDTLAYTASALSFMLEGLKKTVIVTGAQISIFERRSDAKENFLSSLIFAGCYNVGEVCVCFAHELLRGNRTVKFSSNMLKAFVSPNYHKLGSDGIDFRIYPEYISNQENNNAFNIFTNMNTNITVLTFHPNFTARDAQALLASPIEGAVLQSYGIGNIALNREHLLETLKESIQRGVIIVNITQCAQGIVDSTYETGRALQEIGIIPGRDMTLAAVYTKLSYVIGHTCLTLDEKKQMMMANLRGELSEPHI